jgi:hypothetical protein
MAIYFQKNNKVKTSTRTIPANFSKVNNPQYKTFIGNNLFNKDQYIRYNTEFAGIYRYGSKFYLRNLTLN